MFLRKEKSDTQPTPTDEIATLRAQVEALEGQLQQLAHHVAGLSQGIPIGVETIETGGAFTTVPSAHVESMIERTADLCVLDIRGDAAWDTAHIATAKHVVGPQLPSRLHELSDSRRPILVIGEADADALPALKLLAREGFRYLFLAAGGMEAYSGETVASTIAPTEIASVKGSDRALVEKVAALIDADVRPSLVRDGGDLELLSVDAGVVQVRMVGACQGCGAQKMTVKQGIQTYLTHTFPEVKEVQDLTGVC
jgi:Fe-S cluster biogenesis protein NfuA/rhodanese-related sulfurtransferase